MTAYRELALLLREMNENKSDLLEELYLYEKRNSFHDDPRSYLYDRPGSSKVIPIRNFEKLHDVHGFPKLKTMINRIFESRLDACCILMLSPDTDFKAYSSKRRSHILRGHLPLILPYPRGSSGIWINGTGVKLYSEESWNAHDMGTKHNVFNHSSGDVVVLIVDVRRDSEISPLTESKPLVHT